MSLPSCDCSFTDTPFLTEVCGASLFMVLTQFLLMRQCDIVEPCSHLDNVVNSNQDEYDFVVVGAGVAGNIIASRLSENPDWKVLLLEAGPDEPSLTSIPAFAMSAAGTELDWKYVTENSSQAFLSRGGRANWPRGKMVAGSSAMQGMMYTRPHPSIFDEWNKTNPGWSFQDCLPYYKKSENNLNPDLVDKDYHGFDGPMTVQQFPSKPAMCDVVLRAGEELGYTNGDPCGKNQTVVAVAQMMVYEGLRMSTSKAYIRPFKNRDNLEIIINSQATRVLIDQETNTAKGVEYVDKSGNAHTVYGNKEVILSAGAINSPQLLLLSGIGPREDLEQVGIDVVVDLPGVGQNLQNHVAASAEFYMDGADQNVLTYDAVEEFINNRTGSLASTGLTQTTLFMTSKYAIDGVPDLQVFFDGFSSTCSKTGSNDECSESGNIDNCGKMHISARPTNVLPLSRGYLKLNSSDPLDHPLIYPRYLENQKDVDILVDGIKLCIQLANTVAMQQYNVTLDTTPVRGCETYDFGSDEYLECTVRTNTGAENHQAGTCKMGPVDDPLAVVDNELKVHGLNNIRVVDASIFPINPNSNPTSAIIMTAEKISDVIKRTWS